MCNMGKWKETEEWGGVAWERSGKRRVRGRGSSQDNESRIFKKLVNFIISSDNYLAFKESLKPNIHLEVKS